MRSVGGASPYLALFARAGTSRAAADAAVAALSIQELPCARGCTYVVPEADYALALRAGQGRGEIAEIELAKKHCGVTDKEVTALSEAVIAALEKGPTDPKGLKDTLGDKVRHLGETGKKRGLTTTLPLARLQEPERERRQHQEDEDDGVRGHQDEPELAPAAHLHALGREDHVVQELVPLVERPEQGLPLVQDILVRAPLEEEAEEHVRGVGPVVDQEHEQPVGQVEGVLAAGAGAASSAGAVLSLGLGQLVAGCEVGQQAVEDVRGDPRQLAEGVRGSSEAFGVAHPGKSTRPAGY